jgi:Type I restriction-modification system methyltransferase subunit
VFLARRPDVWGSLADGPAEGLVGRVTAAMTEAVPELPTSTPAQIDVDLSGVLRAVGDLVDEHGPNAAFGHLLDRYLDAHSRRLVVTPVPVARLIARLVVREGQRVLDPACGTGRLLVAAHEAGAATVAGQDVTTSAVQLTGAQILLRGGAAAMAVGDSLRHDALATQRFDVVVCDPPVGDRNWGYDDLVGDPRWEHGLPPRGEPELAWAQHCLAHLGPGGTAAVLMPPAAASRRAGRRIRSSLLRAGVLRAVIALSTHTGPSSDIWLLQRPLDGAEPPTDVLLMLASELDEIPQVWSAFRADPRHGNSRVSRSVRIVDLLDEKVDISPARHMSATASAAERDFAEARAAVHGMLSELSRELPELSVSPVRRAMAMTTIGELVKSGLVVIEQAPVRIPLDRGDIPVLTARDVVAQRGPTGRTVIQPGLVHLQPGDVVVPALAGKDAVVTVVETGGAVLGPRLLLLRTDPDKLDPEFLAGYTRIARATLSTRSSSTASRTDVRRIAIPVLPIKEQRRYGAAFRQLAVFQRALRRCADAGEALVELGTAGLADGRWEPPV